MGRNEQMETEPDPQAGINSRGDMDRQGAANPQGITDRDLVEEGRRGDSAALGRLIERYQHRLFNAVYRMVDNREDAQELTQEAFVRALQGLKNFRGQASFYTWLFRIGINLCLNHRRRCRPVTFSALQTPETFWAKQAEGLLDLAAKHNESPAQQAQIQEMHSRVIEALQNLEPAARAVVVLRDIEQLDYVEMAQVLNVPVGTVKSRLFRARMTLRDQLQKPGQ
ncbi:MAG: sigma-70 family RNA polymerase sigma factor [Sedimentisphaerales bacterium]|nr:sigma-70 family RNA polymerase sigma factor [Sedimentisphaerales bacterium]